MSKSQSNNKSKKETSQLRSKEVSVGDSKTQNQIIYWTSTPCKTF